MTADDREYEIEDDSPRFPSTAQRTRPVRIITDEWLAGHDAELVESIAAGFDTLAESAKTVDRERRDVDVVLAHQSAARFVRSHAGNRSPSVAAADSSPTGTPDARCPSRIAHEDGAGLGCLRAPGHHGSHRAGSPPTRWWDDDDRVLPPVDVSYGPTAALGVSPECQQANPAVHATCDGCACDCHPVPATTPTGGPTDAL